LPALPYPFAALEPHIDAQTMQIHHDRHHQAYVTNLNNAVGNAGAAGKMPLEEMLKNLSQVPESVRTAVRNNGGGHWNHMQFWTLMAPNAGGRRPAPWPTPSTRQLRQLRQVQGDVRSGGDGPLRQRLGVAERRQRQAGHPQHGQPGHAVDGEQARHLRPRRVGARLLPEVPEPPRRLRGAFWNVINWAEVNKRLKG
jgi:superoxide dismutase, Fe-Mn family